MEPSSRSINKCVNILLGFCNSGSQEEKVISCVSQEEYVTNLGNYVIKAPPPLPGDIGVAVPAFPEAPERRCSSEAGKERKVLYHFRWGPTNFLRKDS